MKKYVSFLLLFNLISLLAFGQGATGLVGWWTFNGNANDVSGNGLNGIVHGATLTQGMNGVANTAYLFDGSSNYIAIPSNTLMDTKIHSFCALIKPMGFYPGNSQGNSIIWRGSEGSGTFSYHLEFFDNAYDNDDAVYSPTQDVFAGWTGNTTSSTPQTEWYYTPTVVANTWYSVVLTYDGDSTRIYVNGTLKNTFYNTCTFSGSTDTLFFGKSGDRPSYPFWFNGIMDELRFYNRVLSPSEVNMFGDSLGYDNVLPVKFYLDANADCIKESTEQYNTDPLTIEIDSSSIPIDTVSAIGGLYYHANGTVGTVYSFRVISPTANVYMTCPSSGVLYDTLIQGTNATKYIGLACNTSTAFDLQTQLAVSTDIHAEVLNVLVGNKYCSAEPATLTMHFSPKYVFGTASPSPSSVSGNTAIWDLGTLSYNNSPASIHVILNAPGAPLSPGDTTITECIINPIVGDSDTTNNIVIQTDTVRACHDPNTMLVSPAGCIVPGAITSLQYTVEFENTGNDTAHNIYVLDTLSENLDPQSLQMVSSSHPMNISKLREYSSGAVYEFDFPGIDLLDSSHHSECTGMFTFNINTASGVPSGAKIVNYAGIFFDNNPVVMTDTTTNIVGCTTGVPVVNNNSSKIELYPNPATDVLTITSKNEMSSIVILDLLGQKIYSDEHTAKTIQINVSAFPSGVYYIKINGSDVRKFVKQ